MLLQMVAPTDMNTAPSAVQSHPLGVPSDAIRVTTYNPQTIETVQVSLWAELRRVHRRAVALQRLIALPRHRRPHPHRLVRARRHDLLPVLLEAHVAIVDCPMALGPDHLGLQHRVLITSDVLQVVADFMHEFMKRHR